MMRNLIIHQGISKKAEGDGPSFEQQFGLLSNAQIADKFPQLDSYKLAFQLLKKDDDNTEAVGVAVYYLGKSVIYVPSFFRNGKIRTGDIMYIPNIQQMRPLSDPWLAWVKNKDLSDIGSAVPFDTGDSRQGSPSSTMIRETTDPLTKVGSVPDTAVSDMTKLPDSDMDIFDVVLKMGKTAAQCLVQSMVQPDVVNSFLQFYGPDRIDEFAKQAMELSSVAHETPGAELITPLDKRAYELSDKERRALYSDGFFIRKKASSEFTPKVVRNKALDTTFRNIQESGVYDILMAGGDIHKVYVLVSRKSLELEDDCPYPDDSGLQSKPYANFPAEMAIKNTDSDQTKTKIVAIPLTGQDSFHIYELGRDVVGVPDLDIKKVREAGEKIGVALDSDIKEIPSGSMIFCPCGKAIYVGVCFDKLQAPDSSVCWSSYNGKFNIRVSDDDELKQPLWTRTCLIVPKKMRVAFPPSRKRNGEYNEGDNVSSHAGYMGYATIDTIASDIEEFKRKTYDKIKIYSNGSDFVLSDDSSRDSKTASMQEAALDLVNRYNLDPAVAKVMLKETLNGASCDRPRTNTYLITKKADGGVVQGYDDPWNESNIGMSTIINPVPTIERYDMSAVTGDPALLAQAVQTAADSGIKEVFDVTVLKTMAQAVDVFDMIHDFVSDFTGSLDKLCRLLFLFYWASDQMERKYGSVKMGQLEQAIKNSIDSLSELTIFLKMRSVLPSNVGDVQASSLMDGISI